MNCPQCQTPLSGDLNYCPQCGKQLKEQSLSTSAGKQAVIYLVSFFMAPFGLGWGIKYLRASDSKSKIIGIISIALTILSITLAITVLGKVMETYSKIFNDIGVVIY